MNVPDWSLVFFIVWGTTIGPLLVVFWLQKSGLLAKWSAKIKEETVDTVREELPSFVEEIKEEIPELDGKKMVLNIIDDILIEEGIDEKEIDKLPLAAKIGILGNMVINPLLSALQNPNDKDGQLILSNIVLNTFRRVKEDENIKKSILWFLKENADTFIKTVVEEASKNPQFLEELMRAFMASRQEAMSGGGGPKIDFKEEGIVGSIMKLAKMAEMAQQQGLI